MNSVSMLTLHRTLTLSEVRYELVVWEHLVAALLGLGLLYCALRAHGRIGRSPLLAALLALGALGAAAMLWLAGRGHASTRPDVLYALGYGVCCACARLFAVYDSEPPDDAGPSADPPPWWPQFERDLREYLSGRGPARGAGRGRVPVA